jgi:hypothetical protein
MFVTSLPYFLGFASQGDEWRFTGFVFGVEDGNSYIGKMLRGAHGDWLFRTPYTAEEQRGVFAFISYILLGKLTSTPGQHEQLVVLYHFYRIFAGVLAILAMHEFIAIFIHDRRDRFIGLVFACFGGGLGYVLVLLEKNWWLGNLPLEFYSPESFGFLILFGLPHLAMARALFFWGLINYLKNDTPKGGQIAGILWLFMGLFQPLTIVQAWVVVGAHFMFTFGINNWKRTMKDSEGKIFLRSWFYKLVWAVIIPFPLVIYTYFAFNLDPVTQAWTSQNLILSPHPYHYLLAYGLVLPFVLK